MSYENINAPYPMSEENKQALIKHVVHELSKGQSDKAVVEDLCRQYGLEWSQAEQFVKAVKRNAGSTITNNKLYIAAIVSALVGVVLLLIAMVAYSQAQEVKSRPTATAQVVNVDIERRRNNNNNQASGQYIYIVTAQYQYTANGQTYSENISIGRYDTQTRAESRANAYRGTNRTVYYNPQDPSQADFYVEQGMWLMYGAGILGALLLLATFGMVIFAMMNDSGK